MPSLEERREVAENLRTMTMCGCRYAEEFYELLSETVMNVGDFHSFNDVADRLADLIEPEERVCEVEGSYYDDLMEDHYTDLSCGHHVRGAAREFDFCPECGARVIGG